MTERIGLEIADGEIRVARAARRLGRMRLVACERVPTAEPSELAAALARLAGGRPVTVALAFPLAETTHRLLTLPFGDAGRLRETAPLELVGQLPHDPGDVAVGHARLAATAGGSTVLAAVARRTGVQRLVGPLVAAGIPVARVVLGTAGLAGHVRAPDVAFVVADGARSAVVVRRRGTLAGLRALASRPTDGHDAFVGEVRWVLAALDAPPAIVLLGADATPALAATGGLDAVLLDAAGGDRGVPGLSACAVAAAVAMDDGVVLDELVDAHDVTRRARRVAALGAAAALLAVANLGLVRAGLAMRDRHLVAAIHETARATLPAGTRLVAPRAQLEAAAGAAAARAGTPAGVLVLLRELSARIPTGLRLDLDELTVDPATLRLHGRTDRFESVDAVVRALGASAALREVAVEDSRTTVDGRGVEFGVRAGWRAPAGAPS